ncbi:hypothetical protein F5Y07DRAFT_413566 [Xylaria sp. FL0933]|nr:hypothetical protein F5Y07DRAFT_413566 [Xylaria sp. FL0933]
MVSTRAQRAAKNVRNPEDQDQDPPTRKRQRLKTIQGKDRKRAIEDTPDLSPEPPSKGPRLRLSADEDTSGNAAADDVDPINPIDFWRKEGRWPSQLFEPGMERLLARKRSSSVLGRKRSNSGTSITPSDQKPPREEKSAPYQDPRYETLLQTEGTYMETSEQGITDESKRSCRDLLYGIQLSPKGSIFDAPLFEQACQNLQNQNEERAGTTQSPLTGIRPQPDYSVGFRRNAFTDDQLTKLSPFIGEFLGGDLSFFMATYYMYFPFLACEVNATLDVADRQNAHSMTMAARAVVELFRLVERENEVDRQILSFSYYRHLICIFGFTELDGKEKWAAYHFTKNVYDTWMPDHFKRICSVIDQLPSKVDFDGLESLAASEADSASLHEVTSLTRLVRY